MNIKMALLLSFMAGFSTVIGGLFIFIPFRKESRDRIISFALSFSLVIMIGVSVFDLIPEAIIGVDNKIAFLSVILPVLGLSYILVRVMYHLLNKIDNKLYKLGIMSMVTLMLHNFPEGILTFLSSYLDSGLGIKLTFAIAMHNIPEGIAIAVPIYYATGSRVKAIIKTFISGLAEPLGAILAYIFLAKFITPFIVSIVLIMVSGLMITLAIEEILPETLRYNSKKDVLIGFTVGVMFVAISLII